MIQNNKMIELLQNLSKSEEIRDYLMVIYGQFNQEITVSTIKLAERKLKMENFPVNIITKTKIICAEILQNITKHQEIHNDILPYFIIGVKDHDLVIMAGNIVSDKSKKHISEKLDEYKKYEKGKMRSYYLEAFSKSTLSHQGNAGMGLLDIAYRSNQNYTFDIEPIGTNLYSFNLNVRLNKTATATI